MTGRKRPAPVSNNHGKIKQINCMDFITYKHCVFKPGKNFNLIIGPNGSGKSTILAAMVLGLGGDVSLLGRTNNIKDYIRDGCKKATIEIVVYADDGKRPYKEDIMFSRQIICDNKNNTTSIYEIDGKAVDSKTFKETVSSFHIQANNKCQFLPQDKVQDFARMSPQELFNDTINTATDLKFLNEFNSLKNADLQLAAEKERYQDITNQIKQNEEELARLRSNMDLLKERQIYADNATKCEIKLLEIKIEEIDKMLIDEEKRKVLLNEELASINIALDEQQNKSNESEQERKLKTNFEESVNSLKGPATAVQESTQFIETSLDDITTNVARIWKIGKEREERARLLRDKKICCSADWGNCHDFRKTINDENEQFMESENRVEKCKNDLHALSLEHFALNEDINAEIKYMKVIQGHVANLEDAAYQKMTFLKTKFPEVCVAMNWIQENRSKFEGRIYGPLLMELNVTDSNSKQYVENTVRLRDFLLFVCEKVNDVSALIKELCERQELCVNVAHAGNVTTTIPRPRIPIADLEQYGFRNYLLDVIEGPQIVIAFLCSMYNLQNIPIGDDRTDELVQEIPESVKMFFTKQTRYTFSFSKYTKFRSCCKTAIKQNVLLSSANTEEIARHKKTLKTITDKCDKLRNKRTSLEVRMQEHEEIYRVANTKYRHFYNRKKQLDHMEWQCRQKDEQIKEMEKSLEEYPRKAANYAEENKRMVTQIVNQMTNCGRTLGLLVDKMAEKAICEKEMEIFRTRQEKYVETLNKIQTQKTTIYKKYDNVCKNLDKLQEERDEKCEKIRELLKKLPEIANTLSGAVRRSKNRSPNIQYLLKPLSNDDFYRTLPPSSGAARDLLCDNIARYEGLDGDHTDTIQNYNDISSLAGQLALSLQETQQRKTSLQSEIEMKFKALQPKLMSIIDGLNNRFGKYMNALGYVGEILLNQEGPVSNKTKFESFGLQILVQYRQNVALQVLNRFVQSGGERSVAIAVYALALQSLANCPFSCVDEVNQGMDARNERGIFNMLVKQMEKPDSNQFFLLTPKLIPGLNIGGKMVVHVVFNGHLGKLKGSF